ncbi:DUF3068 domain-containing protein [Rhodococcus maanshanensis]|uniref:DUF3068 domain-containing protein n=1 Tax=Rhodococcus maanshanensis TaxID=183556 RepID=A0A1H7QT44_9NOCA|nr:DUF3068 domain-containing protein [Rhodococcus maanshanensis]SEL50894.1 Protein of unknown function [Rhodococcus maanshanensis]
MAGRSGPSRTLACILVGLGAFLLAAAVLIPTYTVDKLKKTPLDLEVTTVAEGVGEVLDSKSLTAGKAVVNTNVPLVAQRYVTVVDPSDAEKITVQAGQTLRRTDKQGDTGLLTATVDTVTVDRVSSMPIQDPIGSIQTQSDKPAEEVEHTGLQYKWPFDAEQQAYPYFDINARATKDIDFVEETEINGMKVYHYNQKVGPVDLSKVVASPTNKLTLPAATWGVEGGDAPVTMTRWYANERDTWVDPITGVVVKGQEKLYQYYARTADKPEVTVLKATLPFNEDTIEYQIGQAKDGADKLSMFGRTVPIILGILGLISLIAGIFLGVRGGSGPKTPAAANGTGTAPSGSANEPYDSGNAETEQFPRHDWTSDKTEEFPAVDTRDQEPPTTRL